MPLSIAAGRFRTPGSVERVKSSATPDETGKVDLTSDANWETYWSGRLEDIPVTANERIYANQPVADITNRITLRRDSTTVAITPRMRVRIGSRKLNITKSIGVGNPPRLIELSCVEVV